MKKILLYGHGGAYNHGAEAILRTSIPIFRQAGCPIFLSTHFPEQDREFGLDKLVDKLIPADLSLVPEEQAAAGFDEKERLASLIYRDALAVIDNETACIAVGGDNYCYPNWHRQSVFHRTAKSRGGSSILWGCSIQPELIDTRMCSVLKEHDIIYARESLTAGTLQKKGIDQVVQCPDTAFMLPPEPVLLPKGSAPHMAAMNVSPLVLRRSDAMMQYFVEAAHMLLKHTDALLLLPHVTMQMDNDVDALKELVQMLPQHERKLVCWADAGSNAAQYKYLISQCEVFVCCRTHASIAGYSTGVPTLVVGYSVKSQGIGADLGMEQWVLPVERGKELPRLVSELWEKRDEIRSKLQAQSWSRTYPIPSFC